MHGRTRRGDASGAVPGTEPEHDVRAGLDTGLAALGIDASPELRRSLLDYLALLSRWNRAYNLSAVRRPADMVTRHLLDSLAVLPYLRGTRVLDLGSGAGLPGIPLALLSPRRSVMLLDSNGKKVRFLRHAVLTLGLDNVTVVQTRAEAFRSGTGFDTVLSRAYATLAVFWRHAAPLLAPGGMALAMKGRRPENELRALAGAPVSCQVRRVRVPGLDAERHVVLLWPADAGTGTDGHPPDA